ncbi:sulfite exporter TauE/SafE family protein [Devriesea agamarum]|uniref:sulfite exporter TauE/SafE family protein n=1 Tax=Devriesea agamarum TaxID=472569 RepID=UPI00071D7419|nr:sulfite exporter TauE/SafE family protein [Devriesea agamarum]
MIETLWPYLAAALAGVGAGVVNAVVGSGTLITFPVLLMLGVPPVSANMTSSLGLLAGNISAIPGYRSAISQSRQLLPLLAPASLIGGAVGAVALLFLPSSVFDAIVPILVIAALVLVALGPQIQRAIRKRVERRTGQPGPTGHTNCTSHTDATPGTTTSIVLVPAAVLAILVGLTGVYGGYFGAAQGVLLLGLLGIATAVPLSTVNGLKVVLVMLVNLVCALVFVLTASDRIDWWFTLAIACGAIIGGVLGAQIGRNLPSSVLRAVVIVVGVIALVVLLT